MIFLTLFFYLIVGHMLCDHPLQGAYLAIGKNRHTAHEGTPWWQCMLAHSFIHGGAVALITGVWWLGLLEIGAHFFIDYQKCEGKLSYNRDFLFHILCKVAWIWMWVWVVTKR